MDRRNFLHHTVAVSALPQTQTAPRPVESFDEHGPLVIERAQSGKPHAGKVLACIQPHSDDLPIFAAGTIFKLIDEGYVAFLIRVTNDDMAGPGRYAECVTANQRDNDAIGRMLGCKAVFDLNYNNHMMDNIARSELRARFIFLFRMLKVDTLITYDPSGHYEENPDHYVTSACAEAAAWMAGGGKDYPEHFYAGIQPHGVREKYYFARFQQRVNRVVDISATIDRKIDLNIENKAQGPGGESGARLLRRLQSEGKRLPLLGNDASSANRAYVREFTLRRDRLTGQRYGLAWAEQFHYIGPDDPYLDDYLRRNSVSL